MFLGNVHDPMEAFDTALHDDNTSELTHFEIQTLGHGLQLEELLDVLTQRRCVAQQFYGQWVMVLECGAGGNGRIELRHGIPEDAPGCGRPMVSTAT